jgi:hypothetical protein
MSRSHAGRILAMGVAFTDLDLFDLWGRYLALGGSHSCADLDEYLRGGGQEWSDFEHDIAAVAVNEETYDLGLGRLVDFANAIKDVQER